MGKLIQYQAHTEPVSLDAERATPDKWQPTSNIPQSNWKAQTLKTAAFVAIVPTLFFVSTFTTEAVTADRWQPQQNEPVREVEHREYEYPSSFIDTDALTEGERSTLDHWFVQHHLPPKGATHHEHLYPSFTTDPYSLTQAEANSVDRWNPQKPDYIWDKVHQEYLFPTFIVDPYAIAQPEAPYLDKWYVQRFLPPKGAVHKEYQYPSLFWKPFEIINPTVSDGSRVHVVFPQTFQYQKFAEPLEPSLRIPAEDITLDKWYRQLSEPRRDVVRNQWLYPTLAIDPYAMSQAESSTVDRWYQWLSEPRRDVRRWQFLYPEKGAYTDTLIVTQTPIDALFSQSDYIYRRPFSKYYFPPFAIDVYATTQTESVTVDRWIGYHPDKVWGKEHREYSFPYFFIDVNLLTTGENITLDKWFRELDRQAFRYKATPHLYPYLSWYEKILISPIVVQGSHTHVIFPQVFQYQQLTRPIDRPPETITFDKWRPEYPSFIWDKRRQQYTFQFFFMFDKFVYSIWTPVPEGDGDWTKDGKSTGSYVLVAKSTATFTKDAKPTATWTKTEESSSTWVKGEKQPNLIEVP